MNDTAGFFLIAVILSLIGAGIGYLVYLNKFKESKEMKKVLKDPNLLLKELQKHGKITDVGTDNKKEELNLRVETNPSSGKEELIIDRIPLSKPPVTLPPVLPVETPKTEEKQSEGFK